VVSRGVVSVSMGNLYFRVRAFCILRWRRFGRENCPASGSGLRAKAKPVSRTARDAGSYFLN
jgi:hypothetical protein